MKEKDEVQNPSPCAAVYMVLFVVDGNELLIFVQ